MVLGLLYGGVRRKQAHTAAQIFMFSLIQQFSRLVTWLRTFSRNFLTFIYLSSSSFSWFCHRYFRNNSLFCAPYWHRASFLLVNPLVFSWTSPLFTHPLIRLSGCLFYFFGCSSLFFCFHLHWCMQSPSPSFPFSSSNLVCFPLKFDSLQLTPNKKQKKKRNKTEPGPHQNDKVHRDPKSH